MANLRINPFEFLIETKEYPHARTRRTTLLEKFADSFRIFFGRSTAFSDMFQDDYGYEGMEITAGLFDYATLFLPILVQLMVEFCIKNNTALAIFPFISHVFFTVARVLFSVLATLIVSPVTLIVGILSSLMSPEEEILLLQGNDKGGIPMTLDEFMCKNNINTLDDLHMEFHTKHEAADREVEEQLFKTTNGVFTIPGDNVTLFQDNINNRKKQPGQTDNYAVYFWKKHSPLFSVTPGPFVEAPYYNSSAYDGVVTTEGAPKGTCVPCRTLEPKFVVDVAGKDLKKSFPGLFELNVGGIASEMEREEEALSL